MPSGAPPQRLRGDAASRAQRPRGARSSSLSPSHLTETVSASGDCAALVQLSPSGSPRPDRRAPEGGALGPTLNMGNELFSFLSVAPPPRKGGRARRARALAPGSAPPPAYARSSKGFRRRAVPTRARLLSSGSHRTVFVPRPPQARRQSPASASSTSPAPSGDAGATGGGASSSSAPNPAPSAVRAAPGAARRPRLAARRRRAPASRRARTPCPAAAAAGAVLGPCPRASDRGRSSRHRQRPAADGELSARDARASSPRRRERVSRARSTSADARATQVRCPPGIRPGERIVVSAPRPPGRRRRPRRRAACVRRATIPRTVTTSNSW